MKIATVLLIALVAVASVNAWTTEELLDHNCDNDPQGRLAEITRIMMVARFGSAEETQRYQDAKAFLEGCAVETEGEMVGKKYTAVQLSQEDVNPILQRSSVPVVVTVQSAENGRLTGTCNSCSIGTSGCGCTKMACRSDSILNESHICDVVANKKQLKAMWENEKADYLAWNFNWVRSDQIKPSKWSLKVSWIRFILNKHSKK